MAVLTGDQIQLEYSDGKAERTCLFALKGVTATDTVQLNGYFKVVKRAVAISATDIHSGSITTITSSTIITIPAGPSSDAIWVLVVGASA